MSHLRPSVALLSAACALAPLAARADLLVTRDGATVETRGGWRVSGRQVVFTLPNGQLSSLRADDVDLDRSAIATARAVEEAARQAVAAEAPAPAAEPVMRFTEKDFPPMTEGAAGEGEEGAAEGEKKEEAAAASPLEVVSWDKVPNDSGDGVQVFGTLRNNGTATMIAPALTISVYGEEGGLLAMTEAAINLTAIPPGKSANFRADFPGLPDFAAARFIPSGRGYEGTPSTEGDEGTPPVEGDEDASTLPDSADAAQAFELEAPAEPVVDEEPPSA